MLRLIGHYQGGQDPTPELALRPGPLPKFDGVTAGGNSIQPPPGPPPGVLQPQSSGSGPIRVPPLTPDKVNQYAGLFEKSGAQNGILPGEQAKQIFERAGLPNEVLGRIWNLADTEQRGALVATEFIIAMHLLASFKTGSLRALPAILPAGLYEAAARRPPSRQLSGATPAMSSVQRQFSGAGSARTGSPLSRPAYVPPPVNPQMTGLSFQGAPFATQGTGQGPEWAVTPADKARFDNIFAGIDKSNRGFITGDEAVPFFSNSKLPEEVLAQIWDLADINSRGHLTREEFAVAMYLIRQQRGKRDGRDSLPSSLPPNLVPPSMRAQVRPPTLPTAPIFDATPSLPKSAADDLFGLDALSTPAPPAPFQAPLSTGGSTGFGDPFSNSKSVLPTSPVPDSPVQTGFKPFAPTSSFGKTLTSNATGGSNASTPPVQSRAVPPQSASVDDLLGDNDPEISKKLTNETTELANLSNQIGTLSRQMQDVQGQRTTSQNELNQATSQKREFELRLAQLRSLYEQEVKDVKGLQERLTASRNDTTKLQSEIAMIDGSYQDLQNQHRQVVTALQADQQENASLRERMRVVNAEIAQMKPQLEKLRSEARQQKGLVAINKKQLLTNESERDKLKTEADELTKSIEENSRSISAASPPPQSTPAVASPALSTMSTTNPFFRRTGSTSESATFSPFSPSAQSPAPSHEADQSFDNVFGPSFDAPAQPEMPQTTFKSVSGSQDSNVPVAETNLPIHSSDGGSSSPAPAFLPSSSTREVPQAVEPPAPPESRQISSSFLPFPHHLTDSLSSSRQVSPPNSRFGEDSAGVDTPIGTTPAGSSAAGPTEIPITVDRNVLTAPVATEKSSIPDGKDAMPGSFPSDVSSHISATPTGGSILGEKAPDTDPNDPFGPNKDQPRTPAAVKDDFDSAFASLGPGKSQERQNSMGSSKPATDVNAEFPPLKEVEQDDESDSGSEHGFDDDFTTPSPKNSKKTGPETTSLSGLGEKSSLEVPKPALSHSASAVSVGASPPTPNAQSSPPTYDQVASPHDKAVAEAEMYSGLLPTREDPTSPPQSLSKAIDSPPLISGQSLFANNAIKSTTAAPVPPAKVPFDDFDDFDDLEDAKEGDVDDDFANISAHDRSGLDEFNPMFDSPPASKTSGHTAQESSTFGGSSNGFGDLTASPASVKRTVAPAATVNDNHDWDAIFGSLDDQPVAKTPPVDLDELSPLPSKPLGNGTVSLPATTASTSATAAKERPVIGRALTEAGEHDDPILKNLTSMGYPRSEALSALEKYDYNLERVCFLYLPNLSSCIY